MIKTLATLILLTFTTFSYALSIECSYTNDPDFQKYSDKLTVDYFKIQDTLDIGFTVPKEIKGLPFGSISIFRLNEEFLIHLRSELVEDEIKSFFNAKKEFFKGLYVSVAYIDGECVQVFNVDLNKHNKFKNLHSLRSFGRAKNARPF